MDPRGLLLLGLAMAIGPGGAAPPWRELNEAKVGGKVDVLAG